MAVFRETGKHKILSTELFSIRKHCLHQRKHGVTRPFPFTNIQTKPSALSGVMFCYEGLAMQENSSHKQNLLQSTVVGMEVQRSMFISPVPYVYIYLCI